MLEKRDVPAETTARSEWPLKSLYVLGFGDEIEISPLRGSEALKALIPNWYGARFDPRMRMSIGQTALLDQLADLVSQIPVYLARRPAQLEQHVTLVDLIEEREKESGSG